MSHVSGLLPVQTMTPLAGSVRAVSPLQQSFLGSTGKTQIPLYDIQQRISQRVEWWTETVRYLQERVSARIDAFVSFIDENSPGEIPAQPVNPQAHIDQIA